MFDHLDRNEYMTLRDTRLEEAVRSAITQMDKMADDYLRDYLTARGIILATPEHDAAVAAKALRDAADAVPVDLWCTYGMVARTHVEGFQEWLRERAVEREWGASDADA